MSLRYSDVLFNFDFSAQKYEVRKFNSVVFLTDRTTIDSSFLYMYEKYVCPDWTAEVGKVFVYEKTNLLYLFTTECYDEALNMKENRVIMILTI